MVGIRKAKEELAATQWSFARKIAKLLKLFPFVRAIFISGELSKGVASAASDIDFLVITAPNRLWLCRSFFPVFKRLLPNQYRRLLCFNTFITEDSLTFHEQTLYSAIELVTLQPLYVRNNLHQRLLEENRWVFRFLPNSIPSTMGSLPADTPQRSIRTPRLLARVFDRLDTLALELWKFLINRKFSSFTPDRRRELFVCTKNYATGYSQDHARRILEEYRRRLHELSLE